MKINVCFVTFFMVCFLLLSLGPACSAEQSNDIPTTGPPSGVNIPAQVPDLESPEEQDTLAPDRQEVLTAEELENMTLRQLAERKQMYIGTCFPPSSFSDTSWREIVGREFNLAIIYAGMTWCDIERQQGNFNFKSADQQISFAQSKDMAVCGHAIIFPMDLPDWLRFSNFSNDEIIAVLENHVTEVVSRYKDQVDMWIPIEEATLVYHGQRDFLYDKLGLEYLDIVYRIVRDIDPDATLLYNDYGNHSSNGITTEFTRGIVQRLKSQGLIDGVGLEMHLDGDDPPDKQDLIATVRSYDIPVHVTELDIDIKNFAGSMEERYDRQAAIYRDVIEAYLESGAGESFSVWGIGDKYSWLSRMSSNADPTPFDNELNPKPAYFALHDALCKD
jgi:endo-1,4-beta-xylanase